jgi:uncharacterized protein YodC (DUF2158 family)
MKMIYFIPGDEVTIKQGLPNKPLMVVKEAVKSKIKVDDKVKLLGIICFWFTSDGAYQEERFNTKDLIKLEDLID